MISHSNQAAFIESHEELERQSEQIRAMRTSGFSNRDYFSCNTAVYASNTAVTASNSVTSLVRSWTAYEIDHSRKLMSTLNSANWSSNVLSEWMLACAFMGKMYGNVDLAASTTPSQKSGSALITTDSRGDGLIYFDVPFPNSYTASVVCNGDPTLTGSGVFANSNSSKSVLGVSLCPIRGYVNVRVNWIATGT